MKRILVGAVGFALWLTSNVFGQALSGTVVGTVTDQSGASVSGATVRVTNADTGLVRTTVTNSESQFRADTFPTGEHGGSFSSYYNANTASDNARLGKSGINCYHVCGMYLEALRLTGMVR